MCLRRPLKYSVALAAMSRLKASSGRINDHTCDPTLEEKFETQSAMAVGLSMMSTQHPNLVWNGLLSVLTQTIICAILLPDRWNSLNRIQGYNLANLIL